MIEQAGKVVEAFKSSPGLLAVLLLQGVTMALIYSVSTRTSADRQEREMMLLDRCLDKTDSILNEKGAP